MDIVTKPPGDPVYWIGVVPAKCDLCGKPIRSTFVDGRLRDRSTWGNLDLGCHRTHGVGVGKGMGQVYQRQDNGRWLKTEG